MNIEQSWNNFILKTYTHYLDCTIKILTVLALPHIHLYILFYLLVLEREKEKETSISCFTYLCTHWWITVCVPWLGIQPATLAYQGDVLTKWATWPGPPSIILFDTFQSKLQTSAYFSLTTFVCRLLTGIHIC